MVIEIKQESFKEPGLYLLFPDGKRLDLTHRVVVEASEHFLTDPSLIPASVKAAADFQPCAICPERETAQLCHALYPTLPFLESIDRYFSYDAVTAVYIEEGSRILHVAETDMQNALRCISILSLIHYCEVGLQFSKYFIGIIPLMSVKEIAMQLYLNIYWDMSGDLTRVREVIKTMHDSIMVTVQCQLKRFRLICKHDAFLNAFSNTQVATEILSLDMQKILRQKFGK